MTRAANLLLFLSGSRPAAGLALANAGQFDRAEALEDFGDVVETPT